MAIFRPTNDPIPGLQAGAEAAEKTGFLPVGNQALVWRAFFAGTWLALLCLVAYALFTVSGESVRRGEKIGGLVMRSGTVKYRPRESILWIDASDHQGFQDGDVVATAEGSHATIQIGKAQKIALGPNSMVGLDLGTLEGLQLVSSDLNLTLYKGNVLAAKTGPVRKRATLGALLEKIGAKADANVVVKSANKTFALTELELAVAKDANTGEVTEGFEAKRAVLAASPEAPVLPLESASFAPVSKAASSPALASRSVQATGVTPEVGTEAKTPDDPARRPTVQPVAVIPLVPAMVFDLAEPAAAVHAVKAELPKIAMLARKPRGPSAAKLAVIAEAKERAATEAAHEKFVEQVRSMGPGAKLAAPVPAANLVPTIAAEQPLTLYTGVTLRGSNCTAKSVNVVVDPPTNGAEPSDETPWIPFLDVTSGTSRGLKIRIFGQPVFERQIFRIPMERICRLPRNSNGTGYVLALTPGVVHKIGGPDASAPAASRMYLTSIADLPALPVTVYLSEKNNARHTARELWLPQGAPTLLKGGYALRLKTAADLPLIFDLIAEGGSFRFSTSSIESLPTKIQLASNGIIQATIGTQQATLGKRELRTIASRLDAEVAFVGTQDDLIALPKASINRANVLEASLRRYKVIQVLSRDHVVILNQDDIASSPDQLKIIAASAGAVLTNNARVLLP